MSDPHPLTAVLLPCFNEETTVCQVVSDFQRVLPYARIYVFDNASTDQTAQKAREAGAVVIFSKNPGKGNVVRHMFADIDADYYIMADGDSTYPAEYAVALLDALIGRSADMVVGRRIAPPEFRATAYRPMHVLGNKIVCWLIALSFGAGITDVFSGYRVFTKRFVKTIPLHSHGFEIELEMTLQALSLGSAVVEVDVPYGARPLGSKSKLNTYRDGFLVLQAFLEICRNYKPGAFFGVIALVLLFLSLAAGAKPILDYLDYRYVFHVPLAILATGLAILSTLSFCIGLILTTQHRYHRELIEIYKKNFTRSDQQIGK
jgi:glycosyltransferase involved in cell wall biosynthesis